MTFFLGTQRRAVWQVLTDVRRTHKYDSFKC